MTSKKSNQGSAIITVLIFLTITVLFISFLVLHRYTQSKLIINYKHKIQTNLNAKSAILYFLQNYQDKVNHRIYDSATFYANFFDNDSSSATYQPWGFYIEGIGTSKIRKSQSQRRFLISIEQSPVFQSAIVMGNTQNPLVVSGNTGIIGDIYVGPQGVKPGTLRGRRYKGITLVQGNVKKSRTSYMPDIDLGIIEYQKMQIKKMTAVKTPLTQAMISEDGLHLDNSTYLCSQNELNELMRAKVSRIIGPGVIILQGGVSITNLYLDKRITLYSEYPLSIKASNIKQSLIFSQSLNMIDTKAATCQFFASKNISISGNTKLEGNCIVALISNVPWTNQTNMVINSRVVINGSLLMVNTAPDSERRSYRITIEKNAIINGLVYTPHYTNLSGNINGTVMTNYFYFYKSPSSYINWLYNVMIDRLNLTKDYIVPIGIKTNHGLHLYQEF